MPVVPHGVGSVFFVRVLYLSCGRRGHRGHARRVRGRGRVLGKNVPGDDESDDARERAPWPKWPSACVSVRVAIQKQGSRSVTHGPWRCLAIVSRVALKLKDRGHTLSPES